MVGTWFATLTRNIKNKINYMANSTYDDSYDGEPDELVPAIPPEDYEGSMAQWMIELQNRGLWNGEGWHGDIWIPASEWWDILETCES